MVQIDVNGDTIRSTTDSEEESIVVTRQEEEIDPEDEADFEREYAKMMAESLESRKHERKSTFDVPLPIRRKDRETAAGNESWAEETTPVTNTSSGGTMAFSLLTKRGNRTQVYIHRSVSHLRILMLARHERSRFPPTPLLPSR